MVNFNLKIWGNFSLKICNVYLLVEFKYFQCLLVQFKDLQCLSTWLLILQCLKICVYAYLMQTGVANYEQFLFNFITVKHLFFALPYFRNVSAFDIFTRLYFRDLTYLLLHNMLWRGFYFSLYALANLRKNIYTPSVFCYDEHKKNFDIHFSMKKHKWHMSRLLRRLFWIPPCCVIKNGYFIARTGQFW